MRILELLDHRPDVVLDVSHLSFDDLDLGLLGFDLSLHVDHLLIEVLSDGSLLLVVHGEELLVSLDFVLNVLVLLFDHVDFTVEHVDIVEEGDVLLFSLDECGDNFLDGTDTSGLLDLLESILNDLDVTDVHVHERLLLFVVVHNLVETKLEEVGT